jgi:hypothetical protein
MKYMLMGVTVLFSLIMGYLMPYQDVNRSLEEKLVNEILFSTGEAIEKKYKIKVVGDGAAMPGGDIRELSLIFNTKKRLSKQSLRKLLVECSDELLNQINSNLEIRPFLNVYPFTEKNIEIVIFNHDQNGRGLTDPEISSAEISRGLLIYRTVDPADSFKYKNEFEETLEQALKDLKN